LFSGQLKKRYLHLIVHSNTVYSGKDMEAIQMSIKGLTDKEDVVYTHTHTHTHNEILLTIKKNEILPLQQHEWMWRLLYLVKLSQTEKDKYCMILHI